MPVFQLILTSDTINQGREKINVAFSATTGLWSGSTGFQSLIHNNGTGNIASGDYAISTGSGSTASGDFSFAQGIENLASGIASHAEGFQTSALGFFSHAEGGNTIASGNFSHVQGVLTTASGNFSHAEGVSTSASGFSSHAEGSDTTALGYASHAEGERTEANGIASHAQGLNTIADGDYSFAGGKGRIVFPNFEPILAEGETSFAFYHQDAATFPNFGARADYSVILGGKNHFIASSDSSVILGGEENIINSTLSLNSIIGGFGNIVEDQSAASTILGGALNIITAANFYSSIISSSNTSIGSNGGTIVGLNSAISAIGCLIPNGRSNNIISGRGALTRIFTGNTGGYFTMGHASGGFLVPPTPNTSNNTLSIEISTGRIRTTGALFPGTGADYAEYFEWLDRNPNNEDRVGYFVSLSGEVIEKGNYSVIGIVSSNPAVIGDASSLHWNEMWLKDEFGRNEILEHFECMSSSTGNTFIEMSQKEIYLVKYEMLLKLFEKKVISIELEENVDIYFSELPNIRNFNGTLYTGDTSAFTLIRYGKNYIPNPRFEIDSEYTPREERPEWSPIGLLGKLHVRTAESITGSTISANSDGMAVNGSDYHVLKQVMDFNEDKGYGVVQILFK